MADPFDVIVIGGGPGGYVAAIRAAQLGQRAAVVERDKPGGRCLNYACIPAKTMLHTAEVYDRALNGEELGVEVQGVRLDWKALGVRRTAVSQTLSEGVAFLLEKNKVAWLQGQGTLTADGNVQLGNEVYEAKGVVLATGSVALPIPGVAFSGRIIHTWGAWSLPSQPKSIAVVGAGASGTEIASGFARYGTEVTLIERLDQILPLEDKDMARVVERTLRKQGVNVLTKTEVQAVDEGSASVRVNAGDAELTAEYVVIAGGRAPDTGALNLAEAKIEIEEDGRIKIDDFQRTSNPKVYAIGDLVRGPALAHKASEEGVVAVETIVGEPTHSVDIDLIPGATFCHPQVASVGLTEAAAKEAGHDVKVGKFKLGGVGAATVYDDRAGMVKIIAEAKDGEILGAHIVGNRACDMIAELVTAIALSGGYRELARIVHPHPTISEAVLDAARAVDGWATHQ